MYAGTFPWVIDVVSFGAKDYYLHINVTDTLNLTDSAVIEYTGMSLPV